MATLKRIRACRLGQEVNRGRFPLLELLTALCRSKKVPGDGLVKAIAMGMAYDAGDSFIDRASDRPARPGTPGSLSNAQLLRAQPRAARGLAYSADIKNRAPRSPDLRS